MECSSICSTLKHAFASCDAGKCIMVTADKSRLVWCVNCDQTEVERHEGGEHGEKNSGDDEKVLRIKWSGEDEAEASPEEETPFLSSRGRKIPKTSVGPNLLLVFPILASQKRNLNKFFLHLQKLLKIQAKKKFLLQ